MSAAAIFESQSLKTTSDTELLEYLAHCNSTINRCRYEFLLAAVELEDRELAPSKGSPNAAEYIHRTFKVARKTAYEYIRLGRVVKQFPRIGHLLASSQISYSMLRILTPFLTTEREETIINLCSKVAAGDLKARLEDLYGTPHSGPEPVNSVNLRMDEKTGRYEVSMSLDAATGHLLECMLKAGELAFFDEEIGESNEPPADENSPYMFSHPEIDQALATAHAHYEGLDDKSVTLYGPALPHRAYAGLIGMLKLVQSAPHPALQAPGAQVTVIANQQGNATIPANPRVKNEAVANMIANGTIRSHEVEDDGLTICYGRKRRLASAAQIQALLGQWGKECAMPGCHHTRFIEMHHIKEWAEGGMTDINNLIPLCSRCHSLVSDGMILIEQEPEDSSLLWFIFANGEAFISKNRTHPLRVSDGEESAYGLTLKQAPPLRENGSFDDIEEEDTVVRVDGARQIRQAVARIKHGWLDTANSWIDALG